MQYLTLHQLDTLTAKKRTRYKILSFLKEIKILIVIFGISVVGVTIFTNAQLFMASLETVFSGDAPQQQNIKQVMYQNNTISSIIDQQYLQDKTVESIKQQYESAQNTSIPLAKDSELLLVENLKGYDFTFNTLPPTNRLIIQKFNVDDPIVMSQFTNMDDFIYKNYNEELKSGVVKYPTTPEPGESGNTLIFGHTSQERWKHNKYGMAFAHIAEIQIGDIIQVVWDGTLYEYKVVDIQVQYPQDVNKTYMQYANLKKNYLTLMGCYPIGTSKQRILVISERID